MDRLDYRRLYRALEKRAREIVSYDTCEAESRIKIDELILRKHEVDVRYTTHFKDGTSINNVETYKAKLFWAEDLPRAFDRAYASR